MRQINQNILKIKDSVTGEFKTIPNLITDNSDPDISIDDTTVSVDRTWSSQKINEEISKIVENSITNWGDVIYPVGSLYMSVSLVDPSVLFGGTWERIKDTFLLSAGDTYNAGSTGGEATHILTSNELPSHKHPTYNGAGWAYMEINRDGTGARTQLATSTSSGKYAFTATKTGDLQWAYNQTGIFGDGQAHNNMPPYLAVYVWKRVA